MNLQGEELYIPECTRAYMYKSIHEKFVRGTPYGMYGV